MSLSAEEIADNFSWTGTASGKFTLRTALQIVSGEEGSMVQGLWKKIWKVHVPERIRHFLWLVAHDAVLCNANRVRRHMGSDPSCGLCNGHSETTLHILRDCTKAKEVWSELLDGASTQGFFEGDLNLWLQSNLCREDLWPAIFAFGVWWLWKWRNARVFESNMRITIPRHQFVMDRAREYRELREHRKRGVTVSGGAEHWSRPAIGWAKLNTDGAFREGEPFVCAGGLIRDDHGMFLRGFTVKAPGNSAFYAELFGLLQGLTIAADMGITKLEVEIDAMEVFEIVSGEEQTAPNFRHLINRARNLLREHDWTVTLKYKPRMSNMAADWMAKYGFQCTGDYNLFLNPPPGAYQIIEGDRAISESL